ncbi:hypothetical protein NXS19_008491 [Fusarium pseudograminearum]|nr:hypothetical protein NXS19_008491 [Fusarium pseudograminearum]
MRHCIINGNPARPGDVELDLLSQVLRESQLGKAWIDAIYNLFVSVVQKARYDVEQQKHQREAEVTQHQQELARLKLENEALQAKQYTVDEALAVLITSLPECLQAVRTSIETGTSTTSTKLDIAVNVFRDEQIHQRALRQSITNSNDRVAGLVDHFSTTVDDENNDLVAGDTRFGKLDGIADTVDKVRKTLIAVQAGVCNIDILAKAVNRIETSCGKLEGLPDAFLDTMSRLEVLAASCGKLDGISKVINRASDKLVEIETSSGDTAELATISEAHQRKLAESAVNIEGRLVTKLMETQFAARMRPTDAKINALKQAVDDLPSRSDLASEISPNSQLDL